MLWLPAQWRVLGERSAGEEAAGHTDYLEMPPPPAPTPLHSPPPAPTPLHFSFTVVVYLGRGPNEWWREGCPEA